MEGLVLSENRIFLLCDNLGDVPAGDTRGFGMYYLDTRFLSALQLEINGFRPELLTSSAEHNYLSNIQLTNPAFLLPDGKPVAPQTISIRRNRFIDGALEERIGLFNYNRFPIPIELTLIYSADFRDMFDVRGYYRAERGEVLDPTCDGQPFSPQSTSDIISLNYLGRDGVPRRTDLTFEQEVEEATAIIARARGLVQDQMALGYIAMPEGSRAPAPTRQAAKAAAKAAGDYAGELADKAVDKIGPAADKLAAATQAAIDKAAGAFRRATAGMKKDDGVEDAEVVSEEPPEWRPPAADPEPPAGAGSKDE